MKRGLLAVACRSFPRDTRARQSGELVDTAVLTANGSAWRAAREAFSLVTAGLRQRLHVTERDTSVQDGVALLAGVLAVVNLAVALYGVSLAIVSRQLPNISVPFNFVFKNPYVVDWWWIAFSLAALGIVLGLALGSRRLAIVAALVNLGIVGYDALFLAKTTVYGGAHMNVFGYLQGTDAYPLGQEWLAPAIVLALATVAARSTRRALLRVPLALVAAALLVVLARHDSGGLIFLVWPAGLVLVLALALGWWAPRLAVVALGVSAALAPSVVEYLTGPAWAYRAPAVSWIVAPGLALGIVLPLAYLTRRRVA